LNRLLVERVRQKRNIPKYVVADMLEVTFESLAELLCEGEVVNIKGFGTFLPLLFKPNPCLHPRTRTRFYPKARFLPRFRPSRLLKQKMKVNLKVNAN